MAFLKKSGRHRETIYTVECILLGGNFLKSPVSHFSFIMLCLFYNGYNDIKMKILNCIKNLSEKIILNWISNLSEKIILNWISNLSEKILMIWISYLTEKLNYPESNKQFVWENNTELNKQFVWENNTDLNKQFVKENNSDFNKQFVDEIIRILFLKLILILISNSLKNNVDL